jgi:gamma-glutamyl hercynylcysteine S-oxide synthase
MQMFKIQRKGYPFWQQAAACCFALAAIACAGPTAHAQDTKYPARNSQIPLPACFGAPDIVMDYSACTPLKVEEWRKDIRRWRDEVRIRAGYDDAQYRRPELQWAQSSFMQPQMMAEDRYFYDSATGKYTVDRYLDDLKTRFGGIDSVLIWQSYPNIGIDSRSQYDLIRALPGGIPALRAMVEDFHKRG